MDRLYANVPSIEELEEGHQNLVQLDGNTFDVSTTNDIPDAVYDTLSHMYIAAPQTPLDTRDDADVLADWGLTVTTTGSVVTTFIVMDRTDTGKGIQITSERPTTGWTLESVDFDKIEYGRGYFIDFMVMEPADKTDIKPITFYFGSFVNQVDSGVPGSDILYKYKLEILSNENGVAASSIYERNEDYTGAVNEKEWINLGIFQLLAKDFWNKNHRIWIQPITQRRFIIKNPVNGQGMVIKCRKGSIAEVPWTDDNGNAGTAEEDFTWANSAFKVEGFNIGWVVLRPLEYSYNFQLYAKDYVDINYTSATDMEVELSWYAPDSLGEDTEWVSTFNIFNEDEDNWQGNGGRYYIWDWTITAPIDGTLTGTTKRAATLSDIKLKIPVVTQSNGLSATDLIASADFCVENVEESRSLDDTQSTLTFTVTAARAAYDAIGWPQPNGRCQWQIDTGAGYYIRFDGFIDETKGGKFVDFSDDTYHIQYNIVLKSRWRDAEFAVFTGSYALDGMTRSEVYTLLAEQMGLDTATQLSISADLLSDTPLPQADQGKKKSLKTKIGENVLNIFKETQKFYSVEDKLLFKDDGLGSFKLFITNEDNTNHGTILRSNPTQSTPLVVASIGGDNKPQKYALTDKNFFNDIYVIGGDVESLESTGNVFVSNFRYPPSWQTTTDPLYIRKRRLLIAINPAWNTQAMCNLVGRALFLRYCRFDVSLSVNSFLQYNIYPGDIVTLDKGGDTGGDLTMRIVGMKTTMLKLSRPLSRRYATIYELEDIT